MALILSCDLALQKKNLSIQALVKSQLLIKSLLSCYLCSYFVLLAKSLVLEVKNAGEIHFTKSSKFYDSCPKK